MGSIISFEMDPPGKWKHYPSEMSCSVMNNYIRKSLSNHKHFTCFCLSYYDIYYSLWFFFNEKGPNVLSAIFVMLRITLKNLMVRKCILTLKNCYTPIMSNNYLYYYSPFCGFRCLFTKVCLEDKALWSSDHAVPYIMLNIKEGLLHWETMNSWKTFVKN